MSFNKRNAIELLLSALKENTNFIYSWKLWKISEVLLVDIIEPRIGIMVKCKINTDDKVPIFYFNIQEKMEKAVLVSNVNGMELEETYEKKLKSYFPIAFSKFRIVVRVHTIE